MLKENILIMLWQKERGNSSLLIYDNKGVTTLFHWNTSHKRETKALIMKVCFVIVFLEAGQTFSLHITATF